MRSGAYKNHFRGGSFRELGIVMTGSGRRLTQARDKHNVLKSTIQSKELRTHSILPIGRRAERSLRGPRHPI